MVSHNDSYRVVGPIKNPSQTSHWLDLGLSKKSEFVYKSYGLPDTENYLRQLQTRKITVSFGKYLFVKYLDILWFHQT